MFKIHETIIYFFIFILISSSIYLGYINSIYGEDFHHDFFILSSSIFYKNGLELFDDIFLQYGPGQVIFFDFLSNFININLFSISFITSIIYSLNIFILFKIFEKISSTKISFILIFLIYLIHPYSSYPWPDYLSGLCLSFFYYFFLKKNTKSNFFICSIFLFSAVFFRSTYLINILFAIILFSLIFFVLKKKNYFKNIFISFLSLILVFFLILLYFNDLKDWYEQSIGQITVYAAYTKHAEISEKITSYFGEYGFIILKIGYYFFKSTLNLIDISNVENIIFVLFILINIFFLLDILKNKSEISFEESRIIFICILGLSGFVQSLMHMEIFRNINATMGIFITTLYIIKEQRIKFFISKNLKLISTLIIIYCIILIFKFPLTFYDSKKYVSFNNKYFLNKKLTPEVRSYYEEIRSFICVKENVIYTNVSWDIAISHLCDNEKIKGKLSLTDITLVNFKKDEYKRLFTLNELKENELFFVDKKIDNPEKVKLIKKFKSPLKQKDWYGDIFVYKKF